MQRLYECIWFFCVPDKMCAHFCFIQHLMRQEQWPRHVLRTSTAGCIPVLSMVLKHSQSQKNKCNLYVDNAFRCLATHCIVAWQHTNYNAAIWHLIAIIRSHFRHCSITYNVLVICEVCIYYFEKIGICTHAAIYIQYTNTSLSFQSKCYSYMMEILAQNNWSAYNLTYLLCGTEHISVI